MSHFDKRAEHWDKGNVQVAGARIIADAITQKIDLDKTMEILDFGVGTGLLGFEIAKSVGQVYGIDTSVKMLEKLEEKNTPNLHIIPLKHDMTQKKLEQKFHGIVSSMTLHHIEDLKDFFTKIYDNLHEDGFIAISDLEEENGTFHSDNSGVFHFGFEEEKLCNIVKECGFKDIKFENINTIHKPQRDFGVFLLTAIRS